MKNSVAFFWAFSICCLTVIQLTVAKFRDSNAFDGIVVPGIREGKNVCNCPPESAPCGRGCACCKFSCGEIYQACLTTRVTSLAERYHMEKNVNYKGGEGNTTTSGSI